MKLVNLFEELDKKEKVLIKETEVLEGNFKGEKRIVLFRESKEPVILANSSFNFYKYKKFLNEEIELELYETNLSLVPTLEGDLKQVRSDILSIKS